MDALGDPTRRRIFERLADGPAPVGRLADGLPVSRPAVSQHLRVLKSAGLVSERQVGTRHIYAVEPAAIMAVREYWEQFWAKALDRFRVVAEEQAGNQRESTDGRSS
jgi:DNA-binding transcriptional ArsR family regulator